jgi:hypothetical protein
VTHELWTDYPIAELGDAPGRAAPIRSVRLVSYDGDKYVRVLVDGLRADVEIKAGYVYIKPGRCGEVPSILEVPGILSGATS